MTMPLVELLSSSCAVSSSFPPVECHPVVAEVGRHQLTAHAAFGRMEIAKAAVLGARHRVVHAERRRRRRRRALSIKARLSAMSGTCPAGRACTDCVPMKGVVAMGVLPLTER